MFALTYPQQGHVELASVDRLRAMAQHFVRARTDEQEDLIARAMMLTESDYVVFYNYVVAKLHGDDTSIKLPMQRYRIIKISDDDYSMAMRGGCCSSYFPATIV